MAAKTWEKDFRYQAIQASISALDDHPRDDLFKYPGSFCLPVAEKPLVGWTYGRLSLIFLVLGFVLLGTGAFLASKTENDQAGAGSLVMVVAACCSISGILTFFIPSKMDRQLAGWLLGERGHDLIARSKSSTLMTSEFSQGGNAGKKITIDGDDFGLILFDEEDQRVLIEGIGARYQIRAADVEKLTPYEFMNMLGVEITYRIDSQTKLTIALARSSLLRELIRQMPILFFLRKRVPNKLLENSKRTLNQKNAALG